MVRNLCKDSIKVNGNGNQVGLPGMALLAASPPEDVFTRNRWDAPHNFHVPVRYQSTGGRWVGKEEDHSPDKSAIDSNRLIIGCKFIRIGLTGICPGVHNVSGQFNYTHLCDHYIKSPIYIFYDQINKFSHFKCGIIYWRPTPSPPPWALLPLATSSGEFIKFHCSLWDCK